MTPIGMLEDLARRTGARVQPCKYLNPNVGEWAQFEVRTRVRGYRVTVRLSESYVEIEVKGIDIEVRFSLNTPDRICRLNNPLLDPPTVLPWPIFVADSDVNPPTANWLGTPRNASRLAVLVLNPEESLQVYRNAIVLIGDPQRATTSMLDRLCDLADRLREAETTEPVDDLPFAVENLPANFQLLEPLIRRFAVGDDRDRTDILRETSPEELKPPIAVNTS